MARTYTLKRRAEQQAETRRRIVEAAVEMHGTVGPALTTVSMVAERAGVQRHTLYAHFPDERSLMMACSGLALERDPLPDAGAWHTIRDQGERVRAGLAAIYGWYERNADMAACVLRDAEYHPLTREIAALRFGPSMAAYHDVLGETLSATQRAMLQLALSFFTWRTLVRDSALERGAAVEAMVQAIRCAGTRESLPVRSEAWMRAAG
ncbi:TetR/AcrR family transcriptional regulator [Microvirga sp. M2]|uniref:TetR/AcrR family transcriptional regulator n=1 Tax=Microvirga sp. M2 TaxID=3073270 RepID=UPI0039C38CBD